MLQTFLYTIVMLAALCLFVLPMFRRPEQQAAKRPATRAPSPEDEQGWELLVETEHIRIEKKYYEEVRFGPACFKLRSIPEVPFLRRGVYGDWFYLHGRYVFLQEWYALYQVDTDLVLIDPFLKDGWVALKKVPSLFYEIQTTEEGGLELVCPDGYDKLHFPIPFAALS